MIFEFYWEGRVHSVRRVIFSFHFLLSGQKVKNSSPSGQVCSESLLRFMQSTIDLQICEALQINLNFPLRNSD